MIDLTTDFGKEAGRRLKDEQVIWMTTMASDGTPQPNPVWFYWDNGTILVYSQPNARRLRNIARHPRVSLNFNSDEYGGQVVIITGEAKLDKDTPPANQVAGYIEKYRSGIADLKMTPESFAQDYSQPIRITPYKLRGF